MLVASLQQDTNPEFPDRMTILAVHREMRNTDQNLVIPDPFDNIAIEVNRSDVFGHRLVRGRCTKAECATVLVERHQVRVDDPTVFGGQPLEMLNAHGFRLAVIDGRSASRPQSETAGTGSIAVVSRARYLPANAVVHPGFMCPQNNRLVPIYNRYFDPKARKKRVFASQFRVRTHALRNADRPTCSGCEASGRAMMLPGLRWRRRCVVDCLNRWSH